MVRRVTPSTGRTTTRKHCAGNSGALRMEWLQPHLAVRRSCLRQRRRRAGALCPRWGSNVGTRSAVHGMSSSIRSRRPRRPQCGECLAGSGWTRARPGRGWGARRGWRRLCDADSSACVCVTGVEASVLCASFEVSALTALLRSDSTVFLSF